MGTKDNKNSVITQEEPTSMDFLDNYNVYDDLNKYYVNSYELDTDIEKPKKINKKSGKLHIISNDGEIQYIHTDDVSDRHKQIHEDDSAKSKSTKKSSTKSKTSTKTTNSSTTDKYAAKKDEIRNRLEEKKREQRAANATASTNRTYNADQLKSKPIVESYSTPKKKKKNSAGGVFTIIIIIITLFSSCGEFLDDNFLNSSLEDTIYKYEGNKEDLIKVYETDDEDKEYPYYYDALGNVYDFEYEFISDEATIFNFTKEDIAKIQYLNTVEEHNTEDGYIDSFIDETTLEVYYIIDGTFYNIDDDPVDESRLNIPLETINKLNEYNN